MHPDHREGKGTGALCGCGAPAGSNKADRQRHNEAVPGKRLCGDGEEGFLTLTPKGMEIAERIYERHVVLTDMLIALGVEEETAREDACRDRARSF